MKKHLPLIFSAAACLLSALCLLRLSSIYTSFQSLQAETNSRLSNVASQLNSIYSNIDTHLEEQSNLLSDYTWEYAGMDLDAKTASLKVSILPKEYSEQTAASVSFNGVETFLTLKDGMFTGEVTLPLFRDVDSVRAVLRDGDVIRTQTLYWYISPRDDLLAHLYADISGSSRGTAKDGVYLFHRTGTLSGNGYGPSGFSVKEAALVAEIDGKEISRETFSPYSREAAGDAAIQTEAVAIDSGASNFDFSFDLDSTYTIPFGKTLTLFVEITGSDGLLYRSTVDKWIVDETGEGGPDDAWTWYGDEATVLDASGEVLWPLQTSTLYA